MTPTTLAALVPEAASARSPARVVLTEAEARADFHRAIASVGAVTSPVLVGEIAHLRKQVKEATAALVPLTAQLRAYERPQR